LHTYCIQSISKVQFVTVESTELHSAGNILSLGTYSVDAEDPWQNGYMVSDTWGVTPTLQ
jgi:proline racemase